jgi:hypothetical protein
VTTNLNVLLNKDYTRWTSQQRRMVKGILFERDGDKCFYCRLAMHRGSATIEHLTPRSWGGSNFLDNLVLACAKCNENRGHTDLISHVTSLPRLYNVTHSNAMDHARWASMLSGKRMRVQWRNNGSATLTSVD